MAHGENSSPAGVWRAGSLTADELERLAGAIRPSWEVGLDAADDSAPAEAPVSAFVAPSAEGFAPAPAALRADLGAVMSAAPAAALPTVATAPAPSRPPPPPPSRPAPAAQSAPSRAAAPDPLLDDEPVAPRRMRIPVAGLLAGGAVVLVAALALAFHGGSDAPAASTSAPTQTGAPVAPASAAAPTPAPAPAPEPAPAPTPVVAPAPASAASHAPPSRVAENRPAARPAAPAPAPAAHHAPASRPAAARRPRGVGFVTDSPY